MNIEERFYNEAFQDGVDYAIQRMFNDKTEKDKKKSYNASSRVGRATRK